MNIDCEQCRDLAPELALGTLDGTRRAAVMAHVAGCPACRAEVGDLTDMVDLLANASPPVTPSAGFEERVLAAIATDVVPIGAHRVRRRPTWLMLVAAALIAAAVTGVVVRRLDDPAGGVVTSSAMIAAGGHEIGTVYLLHSNPNFAVVTVRYARGSDYQLQGVGDGGQIVSLGALQWTTQGQLAWSGTVGQDGVTLRTLRVVSSSGDVFCEGQLDV